MENEETKYKRLQDVLDQTDPRAVLTMALLYLTALNIAARMVAQLIGCPSKAALDMVWDEAEKAFYAMGEDELKALTQMVLESIPPKANRN